MCRWREPRSRAQSIKWLSILLSLKKYFKRRLRPYSDTSDDHSCKFRLTLGRLENFCAINVVATDVTVVIIMSYICHINGKSKVKIAAIVMAAILPVAVNCGYVQKKFDNSLE